MSPSSKVPSERDLELLSAYLDGELNDRDRQLLEKRLSNESTLRVALDSLRETVTLVRSLPTLKAPRNFTLDPAIYGRRTPWWTRLLSWNTVLQVSGALGTAAAMLLIALGVLSGQQASLEKSSEGRLTAQTEVGFAAQQAAMPTTTVEQRATTTPLPPTLLGTPTLPAISSDGGNQEGIPEQGTPTATATMPPTTAAMESAESAAEAETLGMMPPEAGANMQPLASPIEYEPGAAGFGAGGEAGVMITPPSPVRPSATPAALEAPALPLTADEAAPREGDDEENGTEQATQSKLQHTTEPTEEATPPTAIAQAPAEAVEATRTAAPLPPAAAPREEEPRGNRAWWMVGLGAVLLVVSVSIFVISRRKARRL